MKKWTQSKLEEDGYKIQNAKILEADISTKDHASACLQIVIEGAGWGVVYGGRKLGHAGTYIKQEEIEATGKGFESILNIMWVLDADSLLELKGKYVRVATKGWGGRVEIIGNILKDEWFDYESFFEEGETE